MVYCLRLCWQYLFTILLAYLNELAIVHLFSVTNYAVRVELARVLERGNKIQLVVNLTSTSDFQNPLPKGCFLKINLGTKK